MTLREAEAATGIPANTLRKWVRRAGVRSYLESDGEMQVRMIDLDAVVARAAELGRDIEPVDIERAEQPVAVVDEPEPEAEAAAAEPSTPPGGETMIVPIDAWNKMLTQLGNLHEAGQQLADARERAAKAETEAEFLRQRLAEIRAAELAAVGPAPESPARGTDPIQPQPAPKEEPASDDAVGESEGPTTAEESRPATTSYWRYVTTGWRSRKRRSDTSS